MSEQVIVVAGGPIGLATAMLLAAEGREVTVSEKDSQEPRDLVEDAFESWDRAGESSTSSHALTYRSRFSSAQA